MSAPGTNTELDTVMCASHIFAAIAAESVAQANHPLTLPESRVLNMAATGATLDTAAVADALDLRLTTANAICDGLVRSGLLTRLAPCADSRQALFGLSVEGTDLISAVTAHRRAAFTRIVQRMPTADRLTLLHGLTAFADTAEEHRYHRAAQL